jgi:hypothetical protein
MKPDVYPLSTKVVGVGLPVILGDVGQRSKVHGVGSRLDPSPKHLRAELVLAQAPSLLLGIR